MGIPASLSKMAKWLASDARANGVSLDDIRSTLRNIADDPEAYRDDDHFGQLAQKVALAQKIGEARGEQDAPRAEPVAWNQWGDDLDPKSIEQMVNACFLPVSAAAALMPDAHVGYGLPIGGVLATRDAIIPYAVGVDIACRMKLTVLDMPVNAIESQTDRLINAIETQTRFGMGAQFGQRGGGTLRDHEVMDQDWNISPITRQYKDKAAVQLGTSGSGNHFVEFGAFTVDEEGTRVLGMDVTDMTATGESENGKPVYELLALLSHSGSRGTGAQVCDYYSKLAQSLHPNLGRHHIHLAWLDMNTHEGQEYFAAMNLMGDYAAANHACIHHHIARSLGADVLADVENHHNFAWKETHTIDGEEMEVIVHRKGATPAGQGVLGVIPGSMASPCYVVRGKGKAESLDSASHGAGRVMSRRAARDKFRWSHVKDLLEQRGVRLLSAGLDEVPGVYKDIDEVMAAQTDLVDTIARFEPRIVKMAPAGERPED